MPLDPLVAREIRTLYEKLNSENKLLSNSQLDTAYKNFRIQFGIDKLQALDGEELLLAMHSRGENNSLVYWLEFKHDEEFPTRRFGSIAGGSAHKFGVYYSQEKSAWMSGSPQNTHEVTLHQAIAISRKQRDEFLAGSELLKNFPAHGSDQDYIDLQKQIEILAPTINDSAWGHKYFSLLHPEILDDFHNPDYQRYHLIRLLQSPPERKGRYICGGRYVAMAAELQLRMNQISTVINELDGDKPYRYWRIGTTEGNQGMSHWENMKSGGYIAVGWDNLGDLSEICSFAEKPLRIQALKKLLMQNYDNKTEGSLGKPANEINRFIFDIHEGDLVFAAKGATVLGVGRVTGSYDYALEGAFRRRRTVDWLSLDSWVMPYHEQLRTTVQPLVRTENLLEAEKRIFGADPIPLPPPIFPIALSLTGISGRIDEILNRKGQVILYGPPGTGKTYWAEIAAREITARSWFKKAFDQLIESERELILGTDQQPYAAVRMCSFHSAYGYEDFIEGYRPLLDNGVMSFKLRDGIFKKLCSDAKEQPERDFILIIDEINRGDIPRIFGELLTIMEKNKRGASVLLPLTGMPFSVPSNVKIIGTMNTADRSIALLDAALRRRFGFLELMPDSQVLGKKNVGSLPLSKWFEALNISIVSHIGNDGRNLQIGHSYLLSDKGKPVSELEDFISILAEDIIPLLQEYCYEDYTALERILGKGLVDITKQRIRAELFSPDSEDELIQALLSHHPELSTYIIEPEPEEDLQEEIVDTDNTDIYETIMDTNK